MKETSKTVKRELAKERHPYLTRFFDKLKPKRKKTYVVLGAVAVAPLALLSTCENPELGIGDEVPGLREAMNTSELTPFYDKDDDKPLVLTENLLREIVRMQKRYRLVPPSEYGQISEGDDTIQAIAQRMVTEETPTNLSEGCYVDVKLCIVKKEGDSNFNGTLYLMSGGQQKFMSDVVIGDSFDDSTTATVDQFDLEELHINDDGTYELNHIGIGEDEGSIYYSQEQDNGKFTVRDEDGVTIAEYGASEELYAMLEAALKNPELAPNKTVEIIFS